MKTNQNNTSLDFEGASSQAQWLTNEYTARSKRTSAYSMRDFATAVGISSGCMSDVMNGKRMLGRKAATRVAENLGLSPRRTRQFVTGDSYRPPTHSDNRPGASTDQLQDSDFRELNEDQFHIIADWEHYAILSLVKTKDFRQDPEWVSSRLGISVFETRVAMQRLVRLGMLKLENGCLVRTSDRLTTTRDIPSAAIRKSYRQTLEQAIVAIEEVQVEYRDFSGITLAVDPTRIPEIKDEIRTFRRSMLDKFSTGDLREVYNLNIQLVPVTKRGKS